MTASRLRAAAPAFEISSERPRRCRLIGAARWRTLGCGPARDGSVRAGPGEETLVALEHSGWDGYDDPAGARDDYDRGWPRMLGLFRDVANGRPDRNEHRIDGASVSVPPSEE